MRPVKELLHASRIAGALIRGDFKNAGLEVEPVMRSQIQIESVKTNTILIEGKVLVTLNINAQNDKFREDMEENLRTKALESGILLNFGDRNVTFKQINP